MGELDKVVFWSRPLTGPIWLTPRKIEALYRKLEINFDSDDFFRRKEAGCRELAH